MEPTSVIAAYQPLPFPLPVWLMQTLLVLGFYLHALPMNVIFGGAFICSVLFFLGRSSGNSYCYRAASTLAVSLPLFISFAITQGIVPLLFLQLLYGPCFYTSSILMAVPWLSLVFIVLVSYYLAYVVVYRILKNSATSGAALRASIITLIMAVGFSLVGFMFSNNSTLMLTPAKWLGMYHHNANGLNLNIGEPQLMARYVHFFVASIATAGLLLGCFGLYMTKKDAPYASWLIRTGSRVYLIPTVLQIPVGLWFLKSIPHEYAAQFMGGNMPATAVFGVSMILMLAALATSGIASLNADRKAFLGAVGCNAVLILTMIINRHQLRLFYLDPHIRPESVPVVGQWDLLAIFLVSAVALVAYLIWLCKLVWSAYHSSDTSEALLLNESRTI